MCLKLGEELNVFISTTIELLELLSVKDSLFSDVADFIKNTEIILKAAGHF